MVRVLFVCLGNICRSPTAHGVFAKQIEDAGLVEQVLVDSAGIRGWHSGNAPDPRSISYAQDIGYDISFIRSRQVLKRDLVEQTMILAMDQENLAELTKLCPSQYIAKLHLFMAFAEQDVLDVPDPYYSGEDGFIKVLNLVEQGGKGLLDHIRNNFL